MSHQAADLRKQNRKLDLQELFHLGLEAVLKAEALFEFSCNYCNEITANKESLRGYLGRADEIDRNPTFSRGSSCLAGRACIPISFLFHDTRKQCSALTNTE